MKLGRLLNFCPYTHLWRAMKHAVTTRRLPQSARSGASIALLGIFCPLFWIALLRGASKGEILFHATHSGVVILVGVGMMLASLAKDGGSH
ncbi:hypothetical protein [Aquicoccus sp. SU-CL01552]|uniref:hypothetical protein n=1 Tax=Aquicoccus sp. SU-CL01552 TaxID=3127656 RepID=UPI00310A4A9F